MNSFNKSWNLYFKISYDKKIIHVLIKYIKLLLDKIKKFNNDYSKKKFINNVKYLLNFYKEMEFYL